MKPRMKAFIALMALLAILLSACTNTNVSKSDRIVPESKRIELWDGGPHQAVWEVKHLTLDYSYSRKTNQITLSGEIKMPPDKIIIDFILDANLIDASGRVIHTINIISEGRHQQFTSIPFQVMLNAPEGTKGMAFSYTGHYYDGLWGSIYDRSFWHTPF